MWIKAPEVNHIKVFNFQRFNQGGEPHREEGRAPRSPSKVPPVLLQDQEQEEDWIHKGGSKAKLERRRNTSNRHGVGIPLPRIIFLVSLHLLHRILFHDKCYNV
jgi:hypothetical protein